MIKKINKEYFLLDKVLPFTKKGKKLEDLNLYQLYFQRYGIGKTISYKILLNTGVHPTVKMVEYKENDINNQIKFIFSKSEESLDLALENKMTISLQNSIDIYDYRGSLYKAKLPLNGQRRRANARTAKRVRPIIIS
jgi:small subunit ribosomal protein S13